MRQVVDWHDKLHFLTVPPKIVIYTWWRCRRWCNVLGFSGSHRGTSVPSAAQRVRHDKSIAHRSRAHRAGTRTILRPGAGL